METASPKSTVQSLEVALPSSSSSLLHLLVAAHASTCTLTVEFAGKLSKPSSSKLKNWPLVGASRSTRLPTVSGELTDAKLAAALEVVEIADVCTPTGEVVAAALAL